MQNAVVAGGVGDALVQQRNLVLVVLVGGFEIDLGDERHRPQGADAGMIHHDAASQDTEAREVRAKGNSERPRSSTELRGLSLQHYQRF